MYAEKFLPQVIAWRRDIHAHPELSQHEERTAGLVAGVLEGLGLEVTRNVGASVLWDCYGGMPLRPLRPCGTPPLAQERQVQRGYRQ